MENGELDSHLLKAFAPKFFRVTEERAIQCYQTSEEKRKKSGENRCDKAAAFIRCINTDQRLG